MTEQYGSFIWCNALFHIQGRMFVLSIKNKISFFWGCYQKTKISQNRSLSQKFSSV